MGTVYKKSNSKFSNGFRTVYQTDPSYGYSFYQKESQNIAQGLYYETPLGKTIVDSLTRFVIGSGLTPMSSPEVSILGWDTERTKKFQKQAEAFYRIITSDLNFDYYGKNPYKELQMIAFKTILNTGDIVLHRGYRTLNNGNVVPYVQIISGKQIMNANGGQDTAARKGGVILNKDTGKEIGYCIQVIDESLNDTYITREVKKYNSSFGFNEFELVTLQNSDPMQVRGVPLLTPVRDDILQVTKLKDNYLVRSAVQNLFAAAIEKTQDPNPNAQTFKEKLIESVNEHEEEMEIARDGVKLDPGIVVELETGEKMVPIQPSMQATDFSAGLKSLTGVISSSFGIPYEVLMSSYTASFSASRASINGAEKNFKPYRDEFNSKVNDLVYEFVIDFGIRSGAIECEEYFESAIYKKAVLGVTWVGVTPLQVDPVKEVKAYTEAIANGLCTHEVACRNLFGMDFEEVSERLIDENKTLTSLLQINENTSEEEEGEDEEDE